MPGHGGVKGNKGADLLAGTMTMMESKSIDWADILTALRDRAGFEDILTACETEHVWKTFSQLERQNSFGRHSHMESAVIVNAGNAYQD